MKKGDFIYRQKQRLIYHFTTDEVEKQIAEINRNGERIRVKKDTYFIEELAFELPKEQFDFVFSEFDYFTGNAQQLKGTYRIENGRLIFSWDHLSINISSASELFLIHEIFAGCCYNFMIPGGVHVKVLDIGMNVGLASLFFAGLSFVDVIFAFEPFEPTFEMARINFSLNPEISGKIQPMNYGLGKKEEIVAVPFHDSNRGKNTSLPGNPSTSGVSAVEHIKLKAAGEVINDLFKRFPGDPFILKIDTEGAEYDILESISTKSLPEQITGIMMEWHNRGAKDLERILLRDGFRLISLNESQNTGLIYGFR